MNNLYTSIFFLLDFYKSPFYFKIQGNSKTTSKIGSIFSFGILAFIFYSLITCDVFKKKNPVITAQDLNLENTLQLSLTKENFDIKMGVTDYFGKAFFPDPTIFKMSLIQQKTYKEFSEMQSRLCDLVYPEREEFKSFVCMKDDTFILDNNIQSENVVFFSAVLSLCNNSTDNVTCKSYEYIKEFFKGKYFSLYHQISTFDIYNYEKPIKQIENLEMMAISTEISRQFYFLLKPLEFRTDDAFIFENDKVDSGFQSEGRSFDFQFVNITNMNNVTNALSSFMFFNSNKIYRVLRKYQKIDTVLASIGGVINILVIIGSIITGIQSYLNSMQLIMNRLYSFYSKENLKKIQFTTISKEMIIDDSRRSLNHIEKSTLEAKINFNLENELRISEIKEENKIDTFDKCDTSLFNFKNRFKEDFKQNIEMNKLEKVSIEEEKPPDLSQSFIEFKNDKSNLLLARKRMNSIKILNRLQKDNLIKENIVISILKYLKVKFKKMFKMDLNYQENLIVKTEEIFNEEIDVEKILKKIKDIDKLKALLFDQKQISMFDFLAKPMIYLENYVTAEEKLHPHFMLNNSISEDKNSLKSIMEYYNELINSDPNKLSYIDRNILKYAENIFDRFNKVLS